jgi:hypothetical protein
MLADKDGANFDLSRRFCARFDQRAEQTGGRYAQTAERLFLQPVADGSRQEILREGGWRIGRKPLPPANAHLLDGHLADARERGVERLSRRGGRLSGRRPAESHGLGGRDGRRGVDPVD